MRIFIFILFGFILNQANAQEEISGYFYPDLLQSGQLNPAYSTQDNFNLGLGSFYYHLDVRGVRYRDLLSTTKYLRTLARGKTQLYLSNDISFNYFDVSFKYKDWQIRCGYNSSLTSYFSFSSDFARFFSNGNSAEIGKPLELGPDLYLRNSSELYLGFSKTIYSFYRLGANLKIINGGFDFSTRRSKFDVTTGDEIYALQFDTDYEINTSYNDIDFSLRELIPFRNALYDNIGVTMDLGFEYFGDNWKVSTSILDVGFIDWKSNPKSYVVNGSYEFDGFGFDDISKDSLNVEWDNLRSLFSVQSNTNRYRTIAPIKYYIGGEYNYNKWTFGGLFYSEWKQRRALPSIAIHAKRRIWNVWELGIGYAIKNRTYSNVGISSILNLGPLQFYALSDNVLGIFINPKDTKLNLRFGMNIDIKPRKKKTVKA